MQQSWFSHETVRIGTHVQFPATLGRGSRRHFEGAGSAQRRNRAAVGRKADVLTGRTRRNVWSRPISAWPPTNPASAICCTLPKPTSTHVGIADPADDDGIRFHSHGG